MKRFLPLLLLAATFVPNPVFGNRAPPPPPPPEKGQSFTIEIDDNAKEAKLLIPKAMMPEEKGKKTGWLGTPTMVVAICLSAAFVTGGLWVARRSKGGLGKTTLAVILAVTFLAAAGTAWADLAIPQKDKGRPPVQPQQMGDLQVKVEVVEKGDKIRLVVNRQHLKQLLPLPGRGDPKVEPKGEPKPTKPE